MTKSLTLDELLALHPCNREERITMFGKSKKLTPAQAFRRGTTVSDVLWVMGRLGLAAECAEVAKRAAKRAATYAAADAAAAATYAADAATSAAYAGGADAGAERMQQKNDIVELLK